MASGVDVVTIGEPLFELAEVRQGEETVYRPGFGGDVSNVAIAAARSGASVALSTRLGADEFGRRFRRLWTEEGVDADAVLTDPSAPTGAYVISYGPSGHAFSYLRRGSAAASYGPADVPADLVASAKVLHVSGIGQAISTSSCDAVFAAIDIARAAGVLVSYDPNLRPALWPSHRARAVLLHTISLSDLCLPSLEDAAALTGLPDADAAMDELLAIGAGVVVMKLGRDGVMVADAVSRSVVAGHEVELVDATGAGDCFDGAFLARFAAGDPPLEAARYANAAAALSVRGHGAVAPLPRASEVEAFLAATG